MTLAERLARTVEQANTEFTEDGSREHVRLMRELIALVDPGADDWEPLYQGPDVIGFDIGKVRLIALH